LRPPAKPIRRLILAPAVVVGVLAATLTLPVILLGAAFVSRYVPGKWRILKIAWFLFLYLLVEAASLTMMFTLWILSGFGLRIRTPAFVDAHFRLFAWMLRRMVASAKFTFKLSIVNEGSRPRTGGGERSRPIMVLSRHAGPGDSMMLMDALANGFKRRPCIVMKEFLQWDPAIDVMINRLPSAFVPGGSRSRDAAIEAIASVAATLDRNDAFVIFPEGANYTERRHLRSIEKLREMGRPDLAERAQDLNNTLPPRSKGVMTALEAASGPCDVFFVGHAGLEAFVTPGDIWRAIPINTHVAVRIWYVPAEAIPPPEDQETWLFDMWSEIDTWITDRLEDTSEPFDDPDEY